MRAAPPPVAKSPRQKLKRFTKRQLHKEARALRLLETSGRKQERGEEKRLERQARKVEAAFKDCVVT